MRPSTGPRPALRAVVVLVVLGAAAATLAGCGGLQGSATGQWSRYAPSAVARLQGDLRAVDSAIVAGDPSAASQALAALVADTTAGERDGKVPPARAEAILAASQRLATGLSAEETTTTTAPPPTTTAPPPTTPAPPSPGGTGPPGHGDTGPPGHGDTGPPGHGDTGPPGHGNTGPPGHGDTGGTDPG